MLLYAFTVPKMNHTQLKNFEAHFKPLQDTNDTGLPYLNTQLSLNYTATANFVTLLSVTAYDSFLNRTFMTRPNRYPDFHLRRGPIISISIISRDFSAANTFNLFFCLRNIGMFFAHYFQLRTFFETQVSIGGQYHSFLTVSNIILCPWCPLIFYKFSKFSTRNRR